MAKLTPETLRARVSTLSLRLQATESSSGSNGTFSPANISFVDAVPTPTASPPSKTQAFVLADLQGRPAASNAVCPPCARTLPARERIQVCCPPTVDFSTPSPETCKLCAVRLQKPEAYTKPFCDFLTENPTIFHAVEYFKTKLRDMGFVELPARDGWAGKLEPGGKYWVTRNGSSIVAFTVGNAYKPGNGVAMIAGHIDALTAKVKPISTKPTKAGYLQLGVAPYAGALNQTWWDRDLSVGGRVVVKDDTGKVSTKLVKLDWPSMSSYSQYTFV
jgi:aminopeptidase I